MAQLVLALLLRSSLWCLIQAPPTSGFPPASALSLTLLAVSYPYSVTSVLSVLIHSGAFPIIVQVETYSETCSRINFVL